MLDRDGYIPGVPCWVDTSQPDPRAATEFYGGLFGWEFEDRMPSDQPGHYFIARLEGRDVAAVGSQQDDAASAPAWNTYVWVDSADDTAARAADAGGSVLAEPFDVMNAGRMAVIADPAGAAFCVWQAREHRGAQLVNQAGTWNFSDLNTPDSEAARAFYGALFGWDAVHFGAGEESFTTWCLSGYGDFLEQRDPDLRRRQEDDQAPDGFEDVVATLVERSDVPPHWGISFTVDDPDATADRATSLGGEVVAPPFDAGPVRMAMLRDPHGADFTVGHYDPDSG